MSGRILLKVLLYLHSITADPHKHDRYYRRAKVSGGLLLVILALDLHRYGAWFTGNSGYLYPYAVPILLVISLPFQVYAAAVTLDWFVRRKHFNLLAVIIIGLTIYIMLFLMFGWGIFNTGNTWYDKSLLRQTDRKFWEALLLPIAGVIFVSFLIVSDRNKEI